MSLIDVNLNENVSNTTSKISKKIEPLVKFLDKQPSKFLVPFTHFKAFASSLNDTSEFIKNIYTYGSILNILGLVVPKANIKALDDEFNFLPEKPFTEHNKLISPVFFKQVSLPYIKEEWTHPFFSVVLPTLQSELKKEVINQDQFATLFTLSLAYYLKNDTHNAINLKHLLFIFFNQAGVSTGARTYCNMLNFRFINYDPTHTSVEEQLLPPALPKSGLTFAYVSYSLNEINQEATLIDLKDYNPVNIFEFVDNYKINENVKNILLKQASVLHVLVSKNNYGYALVSRNTIFLEEGVKTHILYGDKYEDKSAVRKAFYQAMINPPEKTMSAGSIVRCGDNLMLVTELKAPDFNNHTEDEISIVCLSTDQDPKILKIDFFAKRVADLFVINMGKKYFQKNVVQSTELEKQTFLHFSGV